MIDERAFIETIRANRNDWGPRLIFADWLEEQGESARAELIRLVHQIYEARMSRQPLLDQIASIAPLGPLDVEPFFLNSAGVLMRRVAAGSFWPGGSNGVPGSSEFEIIDDFYIGVFPVTQASWQAVMGNNPSDFSRTGGQAYHVKFFADNEVAQFPVECVTWHDTQQFVERLNQIEPHSEWTYRLPTDMEWEYACRGGAGSREASAYRFYFAVPTNDLSSFEANFNGRVPAGEATPARGLGRPSPVGTYAPNPLGLFDMHGNVWEWTDTLAIDTRRILRGGGWHNYGHHCSAENFFTYTPESRFNVLGFRLARVRVGERKSITAK